MMTFGESLDSTWSSRDFSAKSEKFKSRQQSLLHSWAGFEFAIKSG